MGERGRIRTLLTGTSVQIGLSKCSEGLLHRCLIVQMLKEREQRLRVLEEKLANVRMSTEPPAIDMTNIDTIARERLRRITTIMQRNAVEARNAIEAIVSGPLRFVPVEAGHGRRYRIEGPMVAGDMAVTESG